MPNGGPSAGLAVAQSPALSTGTGGFGAWTLLTGVYSGTAGTLTLYVNGTPAGPAGQVSGVQPWASPAIGPARLGEDLAGDVFPGYVTDACAFYGALPASVISSSLWNAGNTGGCAALKSTYP
jgi:hypothetical protein